VRLASLRDPPKTRPFIFNPSRVPAKDPEAKLKGGCEAEGSFAGTLALYYYIYLQLLTAITQSPKLYKNSGMGFALYFIDPETFPKGRIQV